MRTFSDESERPVDKTLSLRAAEMPPGVTAEVLASKKKVQTKKWLFGILFLLVFGICLASWFYFKGKPQPQFLQVVSEVVPLVLVEQFKFEQSSLFNDWKEHVFKEKTSYQVEVDEHYENMLHAQSEGTSSVLFKEVDIDLSQRPFLAWEWKVNQFPSNKQNKTLAAQSDNDFGARIYAVFGGKTPFLSSVIQYVWDDHFPEGTFVTSPYARNVRIFVVQSGSEGIQDGWGIQRRDLVKDYQMLFGKPPRGKLIAVGMMSDSDNTGTASGAYFRNFRAQKPKTAIEGKSLGSKRRLPTIGEVVSRIWQTATDQIGALPKRLKASRP